jgi:photosystem II stability/assembly factor-like uncharacterized protein
MNQFKVKDGRVWIQLRKFQPYELLLPYGLTGITDPAGNLNAVRQPSAGTRGASDVVDIVKSEPALPQFGIETRFQKTKNYMFGLKNRVTQIQGHLGTCDRPDNYYSSSVVVSWDRVRRGDLQADRLAIIEGDNAPIQVQVPFTAEVGPILFDMDSEFLSARSTGDTDDATAVAFLSEELFENCQSQEDAGENGYMATKHTVGSATNAADVLFTVNKGETWAALSTKPFAVAMDISSVMAVGQKRNHRVIVANGTTRPSDPAQVAYADVTSMGTATWITVEVGETNGQYITSLMFIDWSHVYATASGGSIYKSGNGGASWEEVYSGDVDVNAIHGKSDGVLWAVGNSNVVLYSNDYGAAWSEITGPTTVSDDYDAVCVTPDGTVFVGNDAGGLYGSLNNGDEWQSLPLEGIVATAVKDIKNAGDSNIWVAANTAGGGKVLRSIDGGASFRLWNLNTPTNSGLNGLFMVENNIVWAVGDANGGSAFATKTNSRVIGLI